MAISNPWGTSPWTNTNTLYDAKSLKNVYSNTSISGTSAWANIGDILTETTKAEPKLSKKLLLCK